MNQFELHFHVKTFDGRRLCLLLQDLSCVSTTILMQSPLIETADLLANVQANPDYLIIYPCEKGWYCVQHNSWRKLYDWGERLSSELETLFIQIVYRPEDEYAYFLAYENGKRIREIEASKVSEVPVMNEGQLFDFENPHADGVSGFDILMFDHDSLVDYCQECGVDLFNLAPSSLASVIAKPGK